MVYGVWCLCGLHIYFINIAPLVLGLARCHDGQVLVLVLVQQQHRIPDHRIRKLAMLLRLLLLLLLLLLRLRLLRRLLLHIKGLENQLQLRLWMRILAGLGCSLFGLKGRRGWHGVAYAQCTSISVKVQGRRPHEHYTFLILHFTCRVNLNLNPN